MYVFAILEKDLPVPVCVRDATLVCQNVPNDNHQEFAKFVRFPMI